MTKRQTERALSGVIAAVAAWAVVTRVVLTMAEDGAGAAAAIWELVYFFTILTNGLAAAAFGWSALIGRPLAAQARLGIVTSSVIVGVVYHTLLSGLVDFEGIGRIADDALHTVVPILCTIHWFAFTEGAEDGPRYRDALLWLAYPAAYVVYVLIRGPFTGWYPYPFLDVAEKGYAGILPSVAGIGLLFVAVGAALVLAVRVAPSQRRA